MCASPSAPGGKSAHETLEMPAGGGGLRLGPEARTARRSRLCQGDRIVLHLLVPFGGGGSLGWSDNGRDGRNGDRTENNKGD
jgi:hypothetical protein